MNILMIHPHDIFSTSEPWSVRIVYIAKEFIKKGHKVKLIYFPLDWDKRRPPEIHEGIFVIPLSRRHGSFVLASNILKAYKLAKWASAVHFQKCFYHAAIPAMVAALLRNKPLHYDWDDWEVKIYEASAMPGKLKNFFRNFLAVFENNIPKIADTVSVASQRLKIECLKFRLDKNKMFDAHVGADTARFHPGISGEPVRKEYRITAKPLVLYLGQLHGGQYVELFIEAAKKLTHEYQKDLWFMIVGDGYRAADLKKLSEDLKLNSRLIFTGAIPHESVPRYIAAADICVACFEENEVTVCKSPLKIVEYLASGKAIVASDVGEVPNMLAGAGVLTRPGDAGSLAEGILKIIDDPGLKNNLENLARKRAEEEYNWAVTAGNILRAYEASLSSR